MILRLTLTLALIAATAFSATAQQGGCTQAQIDSGECEVNVNP